MRFKTFNFPVQTDTQTHAQSPVLMKEQWKASPFFLQLKQWSLPILSCIKHSLGIIPILFFQWNSVQMGLWKSKEREWDISVFIQGFIFWVVECSLSDKDIQGDGQQMQGQQKRWEREIG